MNSSLRPAVPFRLLLICTALSAVLSACGGSTDTTASTNGTPSNQVPAGPTNPVDVSPEAEAVSTQTFLPNANTLVGSSDASTAFALPDDYAIVADDEANVLRVYPRAGGRAVLEWSYAQNGPMLTKELDLEAGTRVGDTLYLTGSNSNKKDGGNAAADRSHLFAVKVGGTGVATHFDYIGQFSSLESQLIAWDSANAHGLGANHFGFAVSAGAGVVPEQVNGFSIEGMTSSPGDGALWLGFRAPQTTVTTRSKALIVPLNNFAALVAGTDTQAAFGTPIELDLGGRGIRSIDKGTDGHYLITAGPAGPASDLVDRNFALFAWDGSPSSAPVELDNDLESLRKPTGGSFESVVGVPGPVAAGTRVQLLLDNGDTVWPGKSAASKDLPAAEQQFIGFGMTLGAPYVDNAGPVLKSASPTDDLTGVALASPIVLSFNKGVRLGAGGLVLHKADGSVVQTFSTGAGATLPDIRFNVVTLTPAQPLDASSGYYLTIDANAIVDAKGNAYSGIGDASTLNFTTASGPTALALGDILFMGGNADATDAFAFVLLKPVNGGTQITFTDRDRTTSEFVGITNESAYVWTADQNLPAGTIVTIQPDVSGNPVASKGTTRGAGGGIGKAETLYAFVGGTIDGLGDGTAGQISAVGPYLASLTLGGAAGTIPTELTTAGTAMSFVVTPAKQTNALYTGSMDRSDLAAFAVRVKDPANWATNSSGVSWPLTNGSLFVGE